jgi:metallophosphoesterase (TIGR00282 family)
VNLLFIGDIFARPGRRVLKAFLAEHGQHYDFIIANGENAAGGFGMSKKTFKEIVDAGVNAITLGNHSWDNAEVFELIEQTPRLIRPLNLPLGTPGLGQAAFSLPSGERLVICNLLGRIFMNPIDDPFRAVDDVLEQLEPTDSLIVDFHAEATSEKKIMGYHLAGRASVLVGTHTHVQTADEQIIKGMAYITDVGMTGVQHSSIGIHFEEAHHRMTSGLPKRFRVAEGTATLCALAVELKAGKALKVERIQWREEAVPD